MKLKFNKKMICIFLLILIPLLILLLLKNKESFSLGGQGKKGKKGGRKIKKRLKPSDTGKYRVAKAKLKNLTGDSSDLDALTNSMIDKISEGAPLPATGTPSQREEARRQREIDLATNIRHVAETKLKFDPKYKKLLAAENEVGQRDYLAAAINQELSERINKANSSVNKELISKRLGRISIKNRGGGFASNFGGKLYSETSGGLRSRMEDAFEAVDYASSKQLLDKQYAAIKAKRAYDRTQRAPGTTAAQVLTLAATAGVATGSVIATGQIASGALAAGAGGGAVYYATRNTIKSFDNKRKFRKLKKDLKKTEKKAREIKNQNYDEVVEQNVREKRNEAAKAIATEAFIKAEKNAEELARIAGARVNDGTNKGTAARRAAREETFIRERRRLLPEAAAKAALVLTELEAKEEAKAKAKEAALKAPPDQRMAVSQAAYTEALASARARLLPEAAKKAAKGVAATTERGGPYGLLTKAAEERVKQEQATTEALAKQAVARQARNNQAININNNITSGIMNEALAELNAAEAAVATRQAVARRAAAVTRQAAKNLATTRAVNAIKINNNGNNNNISPELQEEFDQLNALVGNSEINDDLQAEFDELNALVNNSR